jgi:hypothetical protein
MTLIEAVKKAGPLTPFCREIHKTENTPIGCLVIGTNGLVWIIVKCEQGNVYDVAQFTFKAEDMIATDYCIIKTIDDELEFVNDNLMIIER